jgi:hypothetical protein
MMIPEGSGWRFAGELDNVDAADYGYVGSQNNITPRNNALDMLQHGMVTIVNTGSSNITVSMQMTCTVAIALSNRDDLHAVSELGSSLLYHAEMLQPREPSRGGNATSTVREDGGIWSHVKDFAKGVGTKIADTVRDTARLAGHHLVEIGVGAAVGAIALPEVLALGAAAEVLGPVGAEAVSTLAMG